MGTLTLDLRGVAASHSLPQDAAAREALVSVALHGGLISALILGPLFAGANPPEIAAAFQAPLIRPIAVILPPPPRTPVHPQVVKPRAVEASAQDLEPPASIPPSLNTIHTLDLEPGPPGASPSTDADPNASDAYDCPLGSLCATPSPRREEPAQTLVRIGGLIREPRLLEARPPQYPKVAQRAGVTGKVIIEARVGQDGRVKELRVTEGHPLFDEAARASVRSRRYEPLLLNGVPTEFLITITMKFNLQG